MLKTLLVSCLKILGTRSVQKAIFDLFKYLANKTDNKVDDQIVNAVSSLIFGKKELAREKLK